MSIEIKQGTINIPGIFCSCDKQGFYLMIQVKENKKNKYYLRAYMDNYPIHIMHSLKGVKIGFAVVSDNSEAGTLLPFSCQHGEHLHQIMDRYLKGSYTEGLQQLKNLPFISDPEDRPAKGTIKDETLIKLEELLEKDNEEDIPF